MRDEGGEWVGRREGVSGLMKLMDSLRGAREAVSARVVDDANGAPMEPDGGNNGHVPELVRMKQRVEHPARSDPLRPIRRVEK